MKFNISGDINRNNRRTPHGVRGLKYDGRMVLEIKSVVAPHTGCVD